MHKNFKRFACLFLAGMMIFSMTACSSKKDTENEKNIIVEDEPVEGNRLQADWVDTAVLYEVNVRQYTKEGTFAAFSEHLERLKEMGINTLWFMPIHPISQVNKKGTLGSYYAVADYKGVNSEFGTLEDFKALVDKAHEMGFHVILDWVANHTGWDHKWITEHPEYYTTDAEGKIIHPLDTDWVDVADLNFDSKEMRAAMIDAMKFWVEEVDVDGFRCDYAQGVPLDFWEEARTTLDEVKPIYMVAEDGTNSTSLINNAFDSNYHFDFYDGIKTATLVPGYADDLHRFINPDVPYGSFKMNFLDNHDKNTYDGTLEERFGTKPLGALYTLIFTAEGMPLIYSGNEEDTNISLEFFEKDNIEFGDYKYSEIISRLCEIKTGYEPLYNGVAGGNARIITCDNMSVMAFKRVKNGKQITTIINLSDETQEVKYDEKILNGTILLHGDANGIIDKTETKFNTKDVNSLNAWEYYIILSE